MVAAARFFIAALLGLVLSGVPVRAEDAARSAHADAASPAHNAAEHACLSQKERLAETASGRLIRLSTAMRTAKRRMPGAVVRARLCHGHDGLVYVLTVLAHDGKVARIAVDALKGTYAGDR